MRARKTAPARGAVQEAISRLSLELGDQHREEEVAHLFVEMLRDLFPDHHVCVRLVDSETLELTALYAEGPLRSDARVGPIALRPQELDRLRLDGAPTGRLVARKTYRPVFEGTTRGVAIPLALGAKLYGLLNVEAAGRRLPNGPLLRSLAGTLAVALRNARLLTETEFLRNYQAKLLDHANALVLVCDQDRRIAVFNRAMERKTGFSRAEMIGKPLGRWLPESDGSLRRALAAALEGQGVVGFDARLPKKGGGTIRAVFNTAAVTNAEGDVESIIAIGQDNSGLEALEQQIIQAEKLATLGQLAAGVAHELGNPLTAILAHAAQLQQKAERRARDSSEAQKLRRIMEAAERIRKFTRELTQYARPDDESVEKIDLNDVIDQSLAFCDHLLSEATVIREYALSAPPVWGIRSQLQQVFVNLITNACHAVDGQGTITLRTRAHGEHVAAEIQDDGCGVAEADVERVFEPFFTTKPSGTGLGLSIVRSIVEAHAGRVAVSSRKGKGTTFSLTLFSGKGSR